MASAQDFPTSVIAGQVKALRRARNLTAEDLAGRMNDIGVPFDKTVIANLETGRRRYVTVAELLALAYVFDVAPAFLLVPPDLTAYQVVPIPRDVPEGRVSDLVEAKDARRWIQGEQPLPETDLRTYLSEVDRETFRARFGAAGRPTDGGADAS